MHTYRMTDRGIELAQELELENLVTAIAEGEANFGRLSYAILGRDVFGSFHELEDELDEIGEDIEAHRIVRKSLKEQDQNQSLRALNLGVNNFWTYAPEATESEDRLFEVPHHSKIAAADAADKLVLSGAVGLEYRKHEETNGILTGNKYKDAGFASCIDAAIFIGGYVLSGLVGNHEAMTYVQRSNYIYKIDEVATTVYVSGDIHGDFSMGSVDRYTRNVYSPLAKPIEFAPIETKRAIAYHSVECGFTVAMISSIHRQYGNFGAKEVISDLLNELDDYAQGGNSMKPEIPAFGDYGGTDFEAEGWLFMLNPEMINLDVDKSEPRLEIPIIVGANSDLFLDIISDDQGLILVNRRGSSKPDPKKMIRIPFAHFPMFFRTLLGQAGRGDGRTSIQQHYTILIKAAEELGIQL